MICVKKESTGIIGQNIAYFFMWMGHSSYKWNINTPNVLLHNKAKWCYFSQMDKIQERKEISIGNEVFIGANVTILDGIIIGNGVIIGAGAVVSKDIPDYAIAVGSPIKIVKYRFESDIVNELLKTEWWDWPENRLNEIEKSFYEVNEFINDNTE